jgi:hypothetical protein
MLARDDLAPCNLLNLCPSIPPARPQYTRAALWGKVSASDYVIKPGSFVAPSPRHRTRRHQAALCIAHEVGEQLIHPLQVLSVGRRVPNSCATGVCIQMTS